MNYQNTLRQLLKAVRSQLILCFYTYFKNYDFYVQFLYSALRSASGAALIRQLLQHLGYACSMHTNFKASCHLTSRSSG